MKKTADQTYRPAQPTPGTARRRETGLHESRSWAGYPLALFLVFREWRQFPIYLLPAQGRPNEKKTEYDKVFYSRVGAVQWLLSAPDRPVDDVPAQR